MSGFSRSPRLLKGALVVIEGQQTVKLVLPFQYNPDTLTRSLRAQYVSTNSTITRGEPAGINGPPAETIRTEIELDAADQLEQGLPTATRVGLKPALAGLEALLYPPSELVFANEARLAASLVQIIPPSPPLVLFAWGPKRVLPVRIAELTITEQAFDPDLNPIRAQVSLSMEVLTYEDLGGITNVGGALYMAHHVAIETLSRVHSAKSVAEVSIATITSGIRG